MIQATAGVAVAPATPEDDRLAQALIGKIKTALIVTILLGIPGIIFFFRTQFVSGPMLLNGFIAVMFWPRYNTLAATTRRGGGCVGPPESAGPSLRRMAIISHVFSVFCIGYAIYQIVSLDSDDELQDWYIAALFFIVVSQISMESIAQFAETYHTQCLPQQLAKEEMNEPAQW